MISSKFVILTSVMQPFEQEFGSWAADIVPALRAAGVLKEGETL